VEKWWRIFADCMKSTDFNDIMSNILIPFKCQGNIIRDKGVSCDHRHVYHSLPLPLLTPVYIEALLMICHVKIWSSFTYVSQFTGPESTTEWTKTRRHCGLRHVSRHRQTEAGSRACLPSLPRHRGDHHRPGKMPRLLWLRQTLRPS